ncbi:MAG: hypothetical protein IH808_04900 [Proteobacteria bacterium]|nr:hypothetical protein [Pseudomonadota bacterium]
MSKFSQRVGSAVFASSSMAGDHPWNRQGVGCGIVDARAVVECGRLPVIA